jgi:hypothetical protein
VLAQAAHHARKADSGHIRDLIAVVVVVVIIDPVGSDTPVLGLTFVRVPLQVRFGGCVRLHNLKLTVAVGISKPGKDVVVVAARINYPSSSFACRVSPGGLS